MTSDKRFTWGLVIDVFDVLERHGYHQYDKQHTGQAFGVIFSLAYVYDGTRDAPCGTNLQLAPSTQSSGPGPSSADAPVILTNAEASAVVAALDIAADYKRDRAAACADCADQSCVTCQSRLRDAQAYDQTAAQILHATQAGQTANSAQPEPDGLSAPPRQPHSAADKEAGQ